MVYEWLLARLLPEACPACREPSAAGFCAVCTGRFAAVADPCPGCALPRPVASCPKAAGLRHVASVVAPFVYGPPLDRYVVALKYRGARALGRALALSIVDRLRAADCAVDVLVAVPLHRRRLRERGYNQAEEIARVLAPRLHARLVSRGVRRTAARAPQITLAARERHASTADVFEVTRSFAGLRVAIVDDVITTGATVDSLARVLTAAGAARVDAWAVARTL
jgi:ComF family protein